MRSLLRITLALSLATATLVGCSKSQGGVDTAKLQSSFQAAEPAQQSSVDKVVGAIKDGNYSQAMASLQRLAAQAKLTPEQKQAVDDVIAQVQKQLGEAANKAAAGAQKAASDLQKSLPGK